MRYSHTACKRGKCVHVSSNTSVWTRVPSVSATDGEADVRVLGSQSDLSPHGPQGQEDAGHDVGVPRHQTVTVQRNGVIRRDASPPLAPTPLIAERREKEERRKKRPQTMGQSHPIRGVDD